MLGNANRGFQHRISDQIRLARLHAQFPNWVIQNIY